MNKQLIMILKDALSWKMLEKYGRSYTLSELKNFRDSDYDVIDFMHYMARKKGRQSYKKWMQEIDSLE